MRMEVSYRIQGPLFKRTAPSVLLKAGEATLRELVELGEQRLDEALRPRPAGVYLSVSEARQGQSSTGHYRRNVHGKVSGLSGVITDGGVIYGPWLEGVGSRNQSTRFKGYATFRKTKQWLERKARSVAREHIKKAVRQLGGI